MVDRTLLLKYVKNILGFMDWTEDFYLKNLTCSLKKRCILLTDIMLTFNILKSDCTFGESHM